MVGHALKHWQLVHEAAELGGVSFPYFFCILRSQNHNNLLYSWHSTHVFRLELKTEVAKKMNMEDNKMPDFTVAIGLLRKPIEDLYAISIGPVKESLARHRAVGKIKNLHGRLWQSQRVKTIWHTDRPLSLSSFFYPVSVIRISDVGTTRIRLNTLDDLPDLHHLVFGTVGQGKSILLRFLLGKEIKSGTRIPLLCELRNVEAGKLGTYLVAAFNSLLDHKDDELFKFFAINGKITFLLDGFDEVEPGIIPSLMQEIENLSALYPTCRIALSSRPDSECKHLTSFHSVSICPLPATELTPFYRKITRDSAFTDKLIAAINTSPLQIQELVATPLLATLLAISYRAAQRIPLDFAEFYDDLFQILLTRHDGAKLGWRRQRKTKLNDREIQQVFEAFCFATRKRQITAMDKDDVYQLSKQSLENVKLVADPLQFIEDITKITCLLIPEGKRTSFVHSSVQEFFAARYIKTQTEPVAANFYSKLLINKKWNNWGQELLFLQQIDEHRATKYFLEPDLTATIGYLLLNEIGPNEKIIDDYLSGMIVKKEIRSVDGRNTIKFVIRRIRKFESYHLGVLDGRTFRKLFESAMSGEKQWAVGFTGLTQERTYLQIAHDRGEIFKTALYAIVSAVVLEQVKSLKNARVAIANKEATTGFVDLDDV